MTKTRTRQAIGRQNRARGQAFEREVAKALAAVWPEARRNLSQVRTAKKEGGDILGTPIYWECKSGKNPDLAAAWAQAMDDSGTNRPMAIVYRRGRSLMVYSVVQVRSTLMLGHVTLSNFLDSCRP